MKSKKIFEQNGYKVLAFGSNRESEFFGIKAIPEYFFEDKYSEKTKIIAFNHFVENRCIEEKPDIVIISVPGEIAKYSDEMLGHMGVMLWELKNSVFPDCMICSVPFERYTEERVKYMREFISQMSGIHSNYIHIANKMINKTCSYRKKEFYYLNISEYEMAKEIDLDIKELCNYKSSNFENCIESIIDQFVKNGEIEII